MGTVAVAGDSMAPTYIAGDWLVVIWGGVSQPGDVVLIERENQPGVFLLKRVIGPMEERIWVEGDNKEESTAMGSDQPGRDYCQRALSIQESGISQSPA